MAEQDQVKNKGVHLQNLQKQLETLVNSGGKYETQMASHVTSLTEVWKDPDGVAFCAQLGADMTAFASTTTGELRGPATAIVKSALDEMARVNEMVAKFRRTA